MSDKNETESTSSLAPSSSCTLQECTLVCPANLTYFQEEVLVGCDLNYDSNNETKPVMDDTITLKFLTGTFGNWIVQLAEQFSQERKDVNVEIVEVSMAELSPNVINEATSKTGLFDGFVTPPGVMGSIVEEDGWADLRGYIDSTANSRSDWIDIFLSYRKWISQYQEKILMYPLDGDVLSLFYRKDVLRAFGLSVPRTWEEYNRVAAATHGRVFNNVTLVGSCIGRVKGCAGAYWANLLLSSMTQTRGTWEGHLFDTSDMSPLFGQALEKTLELMEVQALYGPEDQFEKCVDLNEEGMRDGSCVLSYNWGNTFKTHLNKGSVFEKGEAELGVAVTPGSTRVLDRKTKRLVPCDEDLCRFGTHYNDIGWVNRAPYLAFAGWSCAVNNYTTPGKKILAIEFCAYASSKARSNELVAQDAATAISGSDPFRMSHLDVDFWVENGYDQDGVIDYFEGISQALASENAVTDIRFPASSAIYAHLDEAVHDYLNVTVEGFIPQEDRPRVRQEICWRLDNQFRQVIYEYDSQASTRSSALEQYQKLRNVYTVEQNLNQLGSGIRGYGFAIASLTMTLAVVFGIWSYVNRSSSVVRASQPFFLILICLGVFVLASSIFPMAIDDAFASEKACCRACMAVPWLITMGWSILFAALYAKLRRVNLVISNVMAFRSIKVSEKDVMLPFTILFTCNSILMTLWNILDPLMFVRIQTSPTESYGACVVEDPYAASWKVIVSFIAVLNGAALIGANIEAYKGRHVDTEYGESSYIGLIMGSFLQVVLVGLPLYFLVDNNPTARFFLTSSMVFLMCMSVLLLLFVPKWRNLRLRRTEQGESSSNCKGEPRVSGLDSVISQQQRSIGEKAESIENCTESIWKERVKTLESVMQEAGIDAKPYLREANILDEKGRIVGMAAQNSSKTCYTGIVIPANFIGRSSADSSLAPVSEVGKQKEPASKTSKV